MTQCLKGYEIDNKITERKPNEILSITAGINCTSLSCVYLGLQMPNPQWDYISLAGDSLQDQDEWFLIWFYSRLGLGCIW